MIDVFHLATFFADHTTSEQPQHRKTRSTEDGLDYMTQKIPLNRLTSANSKPVDYYEYNFDDGYYLYTMKLEMFEYRGKAWHDNF